MNNTRPAARPAARPRITMPRFTPEQKARVRAAVEALLKRFRAACAAVARAFKAATDALRAAVQAMRQYTHTRHRDRPAWATPYGPAPRHPRTRR